MPSEEDPGSSTLIVAAAGRGSRMKSHNPKPLVYLDGETLIDISTQALESIASRVVAVINPDHEEAFQASAWSQRHGPVYAYQPEPLGTAEAVWLGLQVTTTADAVIVWADHVGARFFPAKDIYRNFKMSEADILVPTVHRKEPYVYFELDDHGYPTAFHETRLGAKQVSSGWSDCGVFFCRKDPLLSFLSKQSFGSKTVEQNFLSLIPRMRESGLTVNTCTLSDVRLTIGLNSREDLDAASTSLHDA